MANVKNCRAVYQRNLWTGYRNANLAPPVTTVEAAVAYRQRILTPYLPGTISPR